MPGTKEGAAKARAILLARDPDYYKKIGSKGGKSGKSGFHVMTNEQRKKAASKGGKKSRK